LVENRWKDFWNRFRQTSPSPNRSAEAVTETAMIVGLGNPGAEYATSRHNAGFRAVDSLADKLQVKLNRKKFGGAFGQGAVGNKKLILLKPLLFMNRSGQVVATAVGFYKLSPANLLVITDDMALEPGRMRIRAKGSAGGHNGLADIIEKLGSDGFSRLRIGIGQAGRSIGRHYVLADPDDDEKALIDAATDRAVDAVLCWARLGVETAMNKFNATN